MMPNKRQIAEIDRIAAEEGKLTADLLVQKATPADSLLHDLFEWNDKKAGKMYRVEQAREIIRSIKVVVIIEDRAARGPGYVRDARADPGAQAYLPVASLRAADNETKRLQLAQEIRRVLEALERARVLAAIFGMAPEIEEISERVRRLYTAPEIRTAQ
jgi:hypothetical protein